MVFFHPTLLTPTPTNQTFCILSMSDNAPHLDAMVLVSLSLIPIASLTLAVPDSANTISLPSSYIPCQPHPFLVYFLFLYRPTSLLSSTAYPCFISLPLCPSLVHLNLPCICFKLFCPPCKRYHCTLIYSLNWQSTVLAKLSCLCLLLCHHQSRST